MITDIVGVADTPCSISLIIYIYICIEMGATPLLSTTDYADGTDECPARGWEQDIKQDKPFCLA